jgi:hypothetical protein
MQGPAQYLPEPESPKQGVLGQIVRRLTPPLLRPFLSMDTIEKGCSFKDSSHVSRVVGPNGLEDEEEIDSIGDNYSLDTHLLQQLRYMIDKTMTEDEVAYLIAKDDYDVHLSESLIQSYLEHLGLPVVRAGRIAVRLLDKIGDIIDPAEPKPIDYVKQNINNAKAKTSTKAKLQAKK